MERMAGAILWRAARRVFHGTQKLSVGALLLHLLFVQPHLEVVQRRYFIVRKRICNIPPTFQHFHPVIVPLLFQLHLQLVTLLHRLREEKTRESRKVSVHSFRSSRRS